VLAASFTTTDYVFGALAAVIIGLSKTAIPGSGLLATPLIASVFAGRLIPGGLLPILLVADLFAVRWYRDSVRWDVLKPMAAWVALGFAAGTAFFVMLGRADRTLEVVIALCILTMTFLQAMRLIRRTPPAEPSFRAAALFGTSGGFTTFVSNNAGPIMNAHLLRLGLGKQELIGTSSWFYFLVNAAKVPVYLAIGWWASSGGHFFTADSLRFDALVAPGVVVGVIAGRQLVDRIPQRVFVIVVLVLSDLASLKLLVGA
jgi:uncharacterized protein